jgi:hypothetical protein
MRIIYSYSHQDPKHEGDALLYHGLHRGAKSVMLLAEYKQVTMPPDAVTRDLLNNRVGVMKSYFKSLYFKHIYC